MLERIKELVWSVALALLVSVIVGGALVVIMKLAEYPVASHQSAFWAAWLLGGLAVVAAMVQGHPAYAIRAMPAKLMVGIHVAVWATTMALVYGELLGG